MAGEPGRESTPFADPADGWEDHLDRPRSAAELVDALETTWPIVAGALDSWTEPMLREKFERTRDDVVQHHSRASILTRLATHEGFHVGEISAILGSHGRPAMDPWDRPNPDVDPA
ncbi:MAG: DinB family protein [Candidatus Dormibacteraceae bacterium]